MPSHIFLDLDGVCEYLRILMKKRSPSSLESLSYREQQILVSVSRRKEATTHEVVSDIPDNPSYSSIRKIMEIMVEKGLLSYRRKGLRYLYEPVLDLSQAQNSALTRLVQSLFNNSPASAVATLLRSDDLKISPEELDQLKNLIAQKATETKKTK
jgi:predicted transcriptional regulator